MQYGLPTKDWGCGRTKKCPWYQALGERSAMQVPLSQYQGHKPLPDSEDLAISTAMVSDRMVIKFHLRVSERAVFCGPAFDAYAPSFE